MEYAGQAYFGYDSGRENNPKKPLVNDDADRFYTELGFTPREPGDYGTSVILPACDFAISDIGQAIEKWWWPLLTFSDLGSKLQIELIEDDGSAYELNPQQRSDLNPFIQALRNLRILPLRKKQKPKKLKLEYLTY